MSTKHKQRTTSDVVFGIINGFVFGVFTFLCLFPFYYIFINSISDNLMVANGQILLLPKGIHFTNYKKIFEIDQIAMSFVVSVGRTVIGSVLSLFATTFLGYALTRSELWHRKLWYRMIVATMYFNAGLIPWFMLMKTIGFLNNFFAYVIPGMISAFNLMLFKTYVENIPPALEESADLDGAGYLVRYFRIVMPLSKPIVATLLVFSAVGQWNDVMTTIYLVTTPKLYTLQFRLYEYLNEANKVAQMIKDMSSGAGAAGSFVTATATSLTTTSLKMTITIVAVLPILMVYPFFQKYFAGGIMIGAVKG